MANVTSYGVLFYGGPDGYQTNRAQIQLSNGNNVVAWLRFNDPGMTFENDYLDGGIIRMHLPSTMFENIIDVLRNEKPINIYFAQGRGFLGTTGMEPVGEAE
ncbi:MAG: hypothetical protein ABI707_02745 [Ferruginibacter sp.]